MMRASIARGLSNARVSCVVDRATQPPSEPAPLVEGELIARVQIDSPAAGLELRELGAVQIVEDVDLGARERPSVHQHAAIDEPYVDGAPEARRPCQRNDCERRGQ